MHLLLRDCDQYHVMRIFWFNSILRQNICESMKQIRSFINNRVVIMTSMQQIERE